MARMLRITTFALAALTAAASFFAGMEALAQTGPHTRVGRNNVAGVIASQPHFKVEAISFTAFRGPPRDPPFRGQVPFSSSVFASFESGGNAMVTTTRSFVRTGDTVTFTSAQNCIWSAIDPDGAHNGAWACDPRGEPGPVRFTILLWGERPNWGAIIGGGTPFCVPLGNDLHSCYADYHEPLFRHTFSYEVSEILARLDPACRCFTETASDDRSNKEFRITFRVTRVDGDNQSPGMGAFPNDPAPVVYRSGTLIARYQPFDLDAGTVGVAAGADFSFSRAGANYFLTPNNGAKIWVGGAAARGNATCYAQRASANYATTQVGVPAVGNYACYVTSDGRVGELQVASITPSSFGGQTALGLAYTTWQ